MDQDRQPRGKAALNEYRFPVAVTARLLLLLAILALTAVAIASGAAQRRRREEWWPMVDGWPVFV